MKELIKRQPVHVVYGGAQLFKSGTITKIGEIARKSFAAYSANPDEICRALGIEITDENSKTLYHRISEKLNNEPVEDYRIDFEDGFGYRTDSEEDETAIHCARETALALKSKLLPEYFGIRVKPFSDESKIRSLKTLKCYLQELLSHTSGELPKNFLITFPKISSTAEVIELASELSKIEIELGLIDGGLEIEIMVETPKSLMNQNGQFALPLIAQAGRGRIRAAHFGAFDYTAELGIIAKYQTLQHPSCDFARNIMKISLEGTGIRLSDGATNIMPIAPHKGSELTDEQLMENKLTVHQAWKLHFDNVMHSLESGFYQGWDLHPAQLIPRYAATYCFFIENLKDASSRLKNFLSQAARSTMHANTFDDAASGQGLLNFFIRGYNCGAIKEHEIINAGITVDELDLNSFTKIIRSRIEIRNKQKS